MDEMNEMNDIHDLAAPYALNALEDVERVAFESHLDGCAACRADVVDYRASAAGLGEAVAEPPPPSLKDRVMADIAATAQDVPLLETGALDEASRTVESSPVVPIERPTRQDELSDRRRSRRWVMPLGIAAAVILLVSAAVVIFDRGDDVTIADVASADDVVSATLVGDGTDVRVMWSRELGRVGVEGDDVAAAGGSNVLELWAIVGETPVATGYFEHGGGDVSELFEIDEADIDAWGITIEPAGGSETPTLPILFYAEI